jgi:hypothetical protein
MINPCRPGRAAYMTVFRNKNYTSLKTMSNCMMNFLAVKLGLQFSKMGRE